MPFFKVWSGDRTVRKAISASSLQEITDKAKAKFQLPQDAVVRVVTEDDGTEVDDDEVVQELESGTILLILRAEETWTPSPAVPASQEAHVESQLDLRPYKAQPPTASADGHTSNSRYISDASPLPPFSPMVLQHLLSGNEFVIWRELISESASYYMGKYPNLSCPRDYCIIGKRMFEAFPCIRREGEKEWSFFIKCLSQRIRHLRWVDKKKTRREKRGGDNHGDSSSRALKSPRLARLLSSSDGPTDIELSDEDYELRLTEIQREWAKGITENNRDYLDLLLQDCFQRNQQWIKSLPDSKMEPVLKKLPCYTDGSVITSEFTRLIGTKQFDELLDKTEVFMSAVEDCFITLREEPDRMIPVIRHVEIWTAFDKGRGIKTKSIITVKEDIPDDEIEEALQTCEKEPPHLLILISADSLTGVFVIGDGVHIRCKKNVTDAMITLIAVYYVFDLEYPKIYSQLLGTLQTHIIPGVPFEGKKSAKYKSFNALLQRKLTGQ